MRKALIIGIIVTIGRGLVHSTRIHKCNINIRWIAIIKMKYSFWDVLHPTNAIMLCKR